MCPRVRGVAPRHVGVGAPPPPSPPSIHPAPERRRACPQPRRAGCVRYAQCRQAPTPCAEVWLWATAQMAHKEWESTHPRRPPASPTMLVKMVVKKALLVVLAGLLESDLPALFPHRASAPCPCPPHQRQRDACWEGIAGRKALPARAWRASTRLQKAVAGAAGGLSHHSHHHTTGSHHQSTNHRVPNTPR